MTVAKDPNLRFTYLLIIIKCIEKVMCINEHRITNI